MAYRKFQANKIFDGYKFLPPGYVLITSQEGKVIDIVPESGAGDDIQALDGILTPGFVNCHCHLELSHMKGLIPEKTGLVDFVLKVVTERHHPADEIFQAITNAENEMLQNGIVAVGDICNNEFTLSQKKKQRLHYYNFIEASGWLPSVSDARFDRALYLYNHYLPVDTKLRSATCSIVPHAPYSVSNQLWENIIPYFFEKPVTIHNQETQFEDEFFLEGTGDFNRMYQLMNIDNSHHQPTNQSSLRSYFTKLCNASSILLVHNTFTKQEDIELVCTNAAVNWCICINANQYIEDAIPPIELLRQNDASIVLGTDSLASNWSLSIVDEIKTIQKHLPAIPLEEMLQWATINGAKALEMDYLIGSFEKDKQPGVIILSEDLNSINRLL